MPPEFQRERDGGRYIFGGMKLNETPDALPPNKYAMALNVRGYRDNSVGTRPGQVERFATGGHPITDMRAYSTLGNSGVTQDDLPRILARDSQDGVWLDNGVKVGTLSGGGVSLGASMTPARPNASPVPWMYIGTSKDYQKFSAPSATNSVTQQKAGIAEPQSPPSAGVSFIQQADETDVAATWTQGGTAGAPSDTNRTSESTGTFIQDPTNVDQFSIAVTEVYQPGEFLQINSINAQLVQDYINPNLTSGVTIQSILYYAGTTGRCVIVPSGLAASSSVPTFDDSGTPTQESIFTPTAIPAIRRGSLLQLVGEVVYVLSVTTGPNGQIDVEVVTQNNHAAGEAISILPTLIIQGDSPAGTIIAPVVASQVTVGIGTLTRTVNFFSGLLFDGNGPQSDDYLHISLLVDNPANLIEMRVQYDVGDGSFSEDYFYYSVRPNDLQIAQGSSPVTQLAAVQQLAQRDLVDEEISALGGQVASSSQLQAGSSQWTEVIFPISDLTRVGNNGNQITSTNKIQLWVNASGTVNIKFGGFGTWGGGQPDVGDIGSPYFYRVRPRSSLTGVVGNPSPSTRYGVSPRRQQVMVVLPSSAYDSQIDTWDVFRYGGTVTSWRFIGSIASVGGTGEFVDNYFDDAASAGEALDFDNFEPWPTVDVPNNGTVNSLSGHIAVVTSTDGDIASYLPGTLVLIGGQNAYTLFARPTLVAGTTDQYLLQFVESAGFGTNISYQIQEPALANQHLPYIFGPDAAGTVFGVGDLYRPGTLNFSKNYAPDQVPDSYNIEITPPSEPLMGGEILDGLAYVASPEKWWALYPQPDNSSQRYNIVQLPVTRGLIAPFGHCNDGASIYWWAKDGIYSSTKGSLTDEDLYNLFPHEGIAGSAVSYGGTTVQPPDYSRCATFRLEYANSFLYATYQDSTGTYHTLVLDTRRMAWSYDQYTPAVSVLYHPEQQAGTLQTSTARYDEVVMGNVGGIVSAQQINTNDIGGPIACAIATREFDGGDIRAKKQWGDGFLDLVPGAIAGVTAQPYSLGASVANPTVIPTSPSRQREPISVGGVFVSDFLGMLATWSDDFTQQSAATLLRIWQPSYVVQPSSTLGLFTFGTSFKMSGFGHLRQINVAYVSTAAITLTATSNDGQSPAAITIPSSGGVYKKIVIPFTANKGQMFGFVATSTEPFQLFLDDTELWLGSWARTDPYSLIKGLGGQSVDAELV